MTKLEELKAARDAANDAAYAAYDVADDDAYAAYEDAAAAADAYDAYEAAAAAADAANEAYQAACGAAKQMSKVLMCDPPSGWKYGFPKPVHAEYHTLGSDFSVSRWLVSEGYPQSEIDACGDHFYCRYYETEVGDDDQGG